MWGNRFFIIQRFIVFFTLFYIKKGRWCIFPLRLFSIRGFAVLKTLSSAQCSCFKPIRFDWRLKIRREAGSQNRFAIPAIISLVSLVMAGRLQNGYYQDEINGAFLFYFSAVLLFADVMPFALIVWDEKNERLKGENLTLTARSRTERFLHSPKKADA